MDQSSSADFGSIAAAVRKAVSERNQSRAQQLLSTVDPAQAPAAEHAYLVGRVTELGGDLDTGDQSGYWKAAAEKYEQAIAGRPDWREAYFRLGLMRERLRAWSSAAEAFQEACNLGTPIESWLYRLAWTLQKARRHAESQQVYREALASNPDNAPFLYDMLEMESRDFLYRQRIGNFVYSDLANIRDRAKQLPVAGPDTGLTDPVFFFWAQGEAAAPPMVQRCAMQARAVFGKSLHMLNEANLSYYVELPECFDRVQSDRAHFSDILRVALLSRYGGVWMDSTCFVTPEAPQRIEEFAEDDLFAFRYTGPRISTWFLVARQPSYCASMLYSALIGYWTTHTKKEGYFMLHHMFEALYWADEEFRANFDLSTSLSSNPPHEIQKKMHQDGTHASLQALLRTSFVHKLTFKYESTPIKVDSHLSLLIRSGADTVGS